MSRNSRWKLCFSLLLILLHSKALAFDAFLPEVVIDPPGAIQTQSPKLFRDVHGVLHATLLGNWVGSGYGPMYISSQDNGRTWSTAGFVVDTSVVRRSVATRPLVVGDTVYVAWQNHEWLGARDIWLSAKSIDGATFTPTAHITSDLGEGLPDLVRTTSGRFVCYSYQKHPSGVGYDHYVAWSDDDGVSWDLLSEPINANRPSELATPVGAIAPSPSGDLYVVMADPDDVLWCYRSDDQGETWSEWMINAGDGDPTLAVAVTPTSTVGVAWSETVADEDITVAVFFSQSFDRGETWTAPIRVTTKGPSGAYYTPELKSDGQGNWHLTMLWNIPWTETLNAYYTVSEDGGTTWLSPPLLLSENNRASAWGNSLVVDGEEHAYAMWTEEFIPPEQHLVFRTNAPPRIPPTSNLLQPDDRVVLRMEQNPARQQPVGLLYQLIEPGEVGVFLWDAQGRLVRQWHVGATEAGEHRLDWDGRGESGTIAASGVYHWEIRVRTADGSESVRTKAVLLQ